MDVARFAVPMTGWGNARCATQFDPFIIHSYTVQTYSRADIYFASFCKAFNKIELLLRSNPMNSARPHSYCLGAGNSQVRWSRGQGILRKNYSKHRLQLIMGV